MFISAWTRKKLSLQFSYYYSNVAVNKRGGQHMSRLTIYVFVYHTHNSVHRASFLFLRATRNYTQNRHWRVCEAINQS